MKKRYTISRFQECLLAPPLAVCFYYLAVPDRLLDLGLALMLWFGALRFAHEGLHLAAFRYYGFNARLDLWKVSATCSSEAVVNFRQILVITLAPLIVMGAAVGTFYLLTGFLFLLTLLAIVVATSAGDILFCFFALRHTKSLFRTRGLYLEVL